jgi:pimeloyl-ACP methyl ester carboxylesterase
MPVLLEGNGRKKSRRDAGGTMSDGRGGDLMSEAGARHGAAGAETIRHEFADVNGVLIHYAIARPAKDENAERAERGAAADDAGARGAGTKLIVFLHGFPEFWYAWRKQLDEFGRDFIAVAPDMRGYNLSSKPAAVEEYDIGKLVGDVRALVEYLAAAHHLRAARCVLVGHDWGGIVAWATAMACPEIVERLVIVNAPHPKIFERELRENPKQQEASQYMVVFRSPQAEAMLSANNFAVMQETIFGDGIRRGYVSEADRQAYLEAWSQPGALTGGLNYYRAAKLGPPGGGGHGAFETKHPVASFEVKMPTLVIWGEKDPYLLTGNLIGLDQYVPKLTLERIPDATHWVVHEKPAYVNELIRDFLETGSK